MPAKDRAAGQPDVRVRIEPVGPDAPRAPQRREPLVGPAVRPGEEVTRIGFENVDDGGPARAARVDRVVFLRLGLRRMRRDVDAGSEHEVGVGITGRIGGRDVETCREQAV